MVRRSMRIASCAMAAAIVFSGMGMTAEAAGVSSVLPNGGVNIALAQGTTLENLQSEVGATNAKIEPIVQSEQVEQAKQDIKAAEKAAEEESLKGLVIAQVNKYVNIRNIPSEDGEIVGKLYNNSVGTFITESNGWYQIKSGNVTGYVKGEYCVTGEAAVTLAKQVGTRIGTVNTTTLYVRTEPTTESSVLGMVPIEDDLVVLEELDGWAKVDIEEGLGWVSTDYLDLHTEFVEAESKEEEERRLAKEAEERRRAHEAAAAKAAQNSVSSQSGSSGTTAPANVSVGSGSEMGVAVAQYALQFQGNPYVYGGTSLTNGADCSGFVMSVYANFGVSLPHSSSADRSQGAAVDGLENAQPGDLVCYSGHVAIYIGNGQIIHASTQKTGIIVGNANYKKVLAVRRIF